MADVVETGLWHEPKGLPGVPGSAGYAWPNKPDMIVVHCSATQPLAHLGAREIDGWHRDNGWMGIGYHYVIRTDGTVERGRPEAMRGAHAAEVNDHSIGICLIGGVDAKGKPSANFTGLQLAALSDLLAGITDRHGITKIVGHRDIPGVKKACPSFNVAHWLNTGEVKP